MILLLGGHGMLGTALARRLGHEVVAPRHTELDVLDADALVAAARGASLVVNAAAYTNVDAAEDAPDAAFAINAVGAGNAAAAAAAAGARFAHVSTDYVFDGRSSQPYPEDAPHSPLGVYGASKAEGETAVLARHPGAWIVRTAWLYGGGLGFPRAILARAAELSAIDVVDDQFGQPTWTQDVADLIATLVAHDATPGILHATNAGRTSWYGFARAIFEELGLDPKRVRPTDSASFARKAPRPANSTLGHDGWAARGLDAPRDWRSALRAAVAAGEVRAA